jgi:hypothetical protein
VRVPRRGRPGVPRRAPPRARERGRRRSRGRVRPGARASPTSGWPPASRTSRRAGPSRAARRRARLHRAVLLAVRGAQPRGPHVLPVLRRVAARRGGRRVEAVVVAPPAGAAAGEAHLRGGGPAPRVPPQRGPRRPHAGPTAPVPAAQEGDDQPVRARAHRAGPGRLRPRAAARVDHAARVRAVRTRERQDPRAVRQHRTGRRTATRASARHAAGLAVDGVRDTFFALAGRCNGEGAP